MWAVSAPYYQAGGVTLYLGDCLDVLPTLAERFDLVFTSPPYNLGGKSNPALRANGRPWRSRRLNSGIQNGYGVHGDDLPWPEYVAWQRRVLSACWEHLTDVGAIFYNHKPVIRDRTLRLPLECNPDLPLRQIITWDRECGLNYGRAHYAPAYEWLLVFARLGFRLRDQRASGVTDLWTVRFEQDNPHPAPFPLALPTRAIETVAPRSVLDPFCGSGTTLLAAKRAGATAVGIEIEERFCEMAARRLSQEVLPLFEEASG